MAATWGPSCETREELFTPLTLAEIERIVDLQIADVRARLAGHQISLELTLSARELIAGRGYKPVYGARPLRRYIQREVETKIGRALIAGNIPDGATISLDADGDQLIVRWERSEDDELADEVIEIVA